MLYTHSFAVILFCIHLVAAGCGCREVVYYERIQKEVAVEVPKKRDEVALEAPKKTSGGCTCTRRKKVKQVVPVVQQPDPVKVEPLQPRVDPVPVQPASIRPAPVEAPKVDRPVEKPDQTIIAPKAKDRQKDSLAHSQTQYGAGLPPLNAVNHGRATFYGGNIEGGNCGFYNYKLPPGYDGFAMTSTAWASSIACGSCVEAEYQGKIVRLIAVDKCPECEAGHLDLFHSAFSKLAPDSLGIIPGFKWKLVGCQFTTPVEFAWDRNAKDGYFSIQTRNMNHPVAKLEVKKEGNEGFVDCPKNGDSGYFVGPSTLGPGPFDVRITSIDGQVLTHRGLDLTPGGTVRANANFA